MLQTNELFAHCVRLAILILHISFEFSSAFTIGLGLLELVFEFLENFAELYVLMAFNDHLL